MADLFALQPYPVETSLPNRAIHLDAGVPAQIGKLVIALMVNRDADTGAESPAFWVASADAFGEVRFGPLLLRSDSGLRLTPRALRIQDGRIAGAVVHLHVDSAEHADVLREVA